MLLNPPQRWLACHNWHIFKPYNTENHVCMSFGVLLKTIEDSKFCLKYIIILHFDVISPHTVKSQIGPRLAV